MGTDSLFEADWSPGELGCQGWSGGWRRRSTGGAVAADATPQRCRHRHPPRATDRYRATRDTTRVAALLHHHRAAPRRATARDVARRPPHQSRHDRRLRPVRPLTPPRPNLRPHDRHRTRNRCQRRLIIGVPGMPDGERCARGGSPQAPPQGSATAPPRALRRTWPPEPPHHRWR